MQDLTPFPARDPISGAVWIAQAFDIRHASVNRIVKKSYGPI